MNEIIKTIKSIIGYVILITIAHVLVILTAFYIYVIKWSDGVLLLSNKLGVYQIALSISNTNTANIIMWTAAIMISLVLCKLVVMVIEDKQNSLVNIIGCLILFAIVIFPVYFKYL